jgi:hexokinase
MAYSQHETIITQKSIDYSVVADAIFAKTGESAFEDRISISILGKLLLNVIKNSISFLLG